MTRAISLLVEEMKAIGSSNGPEDSTGLMVPVAHNERSPVLLFMGGGMGAGKSTVLKDLLNEYILKIFRNHEYILTRILSFKKIAENFATLNFFLIKNFNNLSSSFWSGAGTNAVVVEADAFKERDVIYRAISSRGHHQDMLQTAELVFYRIYGIGPKSYKIKSNE